MEVYLGIDVGSVTTKFALLNKGERLISSLYLRTQGKPIVAIQQGLQQIKEKLPSNAEICGVGSTGSGRYLAGVVIGADIVKNEITCQAVGALWYMPEVKTIIEIGGQDSKIIILRDSIVTNFGMNTVCAAGTGSFLDHQALRLNMSIEEVGKQALKSKNPVRIAGRCTVFAESDMIHKQQTGYPLEDILYGLCQALVRNYLHSIGSGKEIIPPVVFQGGVAFNEGIRRAFEESLETEIIIPPRPEMSGAIGAALLAQEGIDQGNKSTIFKGFEITGADYHASSFECKACPSLCEIVQLALNSKVLDQWGGRCDLWERTLKH